MKIVATYEQFLEECGQLNKELLEILDLRNALNTLRKQAGVVLDGTDIPLQRFDPNKVTVLNEEVIGEYNRLIAQHGNKIFSDQELLKLHLQNKPVENSSFDIPLAREPIGEFDKQDHDQRRIFQSKPKREVDQDLQKFRIEVIQPPAVFQGTQNFEEAVDADEFERKFRQELLASKQTREIEMEIERRRAIANHDHESMKRRVAESHNQPLNKANPEAKKVSKKIISADQAWSNWERFEESIKPTTIDEDYQKNTSKPKPSASKIDLNKVNFLE